MQHALNFLLVGVGGQGTILASDVLVNVGLAAGYQAKQAELHGMSQRGGSVVSHVRWGQAIASPLIGAGEVDIYLAFEKVEALRYLHHLRRDALAVINLHAIEPVTVTSGGQPYPTDDRLRAAVAQVTARAVYVDAASIAAALGNIRTENVVLLGALSALMEREALIGSELLPDEWVVQITARVPGRFAEVNRRAFEAGRAAVIAAA